MEYNPKQSVKEQNDLRMSNSEHDFQITSTLNVNTEHLKCLIFQ